MPDRRIDDGGLNAAGDGLEVYCVGNITRVCLTGEQCPWRRGDRMAIGPLGLVRTDAVPENMSCSPYGLTGFAGGKGMTTLASCLHGDCGFQRIRCDAEGNMQIDR